MLASIPAATFAFRPSGTASKDIVTVAAFRIEITEVTVAAYAACVSAKACETPVAKGHVATFEETQCNWGVPGKDDHPINCVSALDAEAYCRWNGGRRLPTLHEAYWAALGDASMNEAAKTSYDRHRYFPWGNDEPKKIEHCWKRGSFGAPKGGVVGPITSTAPPVAVDLGTCPVASYPKDKSPFGLYDTAGNLAEMVFDPGGNVTCFTNGVEGLCPREKMFRVTGGSWFDNESIGNQSPQDSSGIGSKYHPWYGFRCAVSP